MSQDRPTNRLAGETSPYLLQHAHNPVDWYPWGPEALASARAHDRPILLSIGYAACHWCHVMERESFENPAIAQQMNDNFVCIKVDREERPDLDDIYMQAVQMMSGHGGWPLTAFLTPELEPFAGGTYFPPEDRPHMPGLPRVLEHIATTWRERRGEAEQLGKMLRDRLQPQPARPDLELLDSELIHRAAMALHDRFDPDYGGFGPAPKFPNTTWIALLLRYGNAHGDDDLIGEATFTLDSMAAGGIHDHAAGGFHRYATDARWLVPHFEKMLYDNAVLAGAYLDACQVTGNDSHARIAASTLDWVQREMQSSDGGYYSTLDADSEGVEGKYYVWSTAEIVELLGEGSDTFCGAYGVVESGNWEGTNILHLPRPLSLVAAREEMPEADLRDRLESQLARLRQARTARIAPALDDKILADWNGMMIAAMARGYRVLGEPRYLDSASRAAEFVCSSMFDGERLLHTHRTGRSHLKAYLDDYATMLWGCLELFESSFEPRWLAAARRFGDGLIDLFLDTEAGGFFFTGADHEQLIARTKSSQDGATPSGNAIAATWLQRLAVLTGDRDYANCAREAIYAFAGPAKRAPFAFAQLLLALDTYLAEPREIVVVGARDDPQVRQALHQLWRRYAPSTAVVHLDPSGEDSDELSRQVPLLQGKADAADPDAATFFVCRNYACKAPTTELTEVLAG